TRRSREVRIGSQIQEICLDRSFLRPGRDTSPLSPSNWEMARSCKLVGSLPDRVTRGWLPPPARGPEFGATMGAAAARAILVVAGPAGVAAEEAIFGATEGRGPPTMEIARDARVRAPAARTTRSGVGAVPAGVATEWDTLLA